MLLVGEIIVSEDVVEKQFLCNLNACKGACCWEGDFGAPLETQELYLLERIFEKVKPFLTEEGLKVIEEKGLFTYYDEPEEFGTTLLDNGACVYLSYDENGVALCGIEQAHLAGEIEFKKPISCHLYPIRVNSGKETGFEALNYDKWDICSAACELGKKEKMPVYVFAKDAIIRKYGEAFFEELHAAAGYLKK